MGFKKDFIWGTATAAFQIEGASFEDGKGASIWDEFCEKDGNIHLGHNGAIACDHYHRYKEDVKLLAELGIKAYRFSVSWPRIIPDGTGKVNEKGLEFYNNLVDELLKYGITPYMTLYHWDLPAALMRRGGWMNPDSPKWFENFTRVVVEKLGTKVKNYFTFNEPQCFIGLSFGSQSGVHAPGWKVSLHDTVKMSHNVLIAHGMSVKAIRELCENSKVGFAPTCHGNYPLTGSQEDIAAARQSYFTMTSTEYNWGFNCVWWNDAAILGEYPESGLKLFEKYLPDGWQDDMKTICQPLDFLGENIYNGSPVSTDENGNFTLISHKVGYDKTAMGWPVTPKSLYWAPKFIYERYKLPIIITENGMADLDRIFLDGKVHDLNRIDFMNSYLLEYKKAAEDGVDVIGYFAWSFMDNFEWAYGYSERFGLVYVDYETQKRTPKDSAYWYKTVIENNGENL